MFQSLHLKTKRDSFNHLSLSCCRISTLFASWGRVVQSGFYTHPCLETATNPPQNPMLLKPVALSVLSHRAPRQCVTPLPMPCTKGDPLLFPSLFLTPRLLDRGDFTPREAKISLFLCAKHTHVQQGTKWTRSVPVTLKSHGGILKKSPGAPKVQ